jgi:hypothetical protein
LPYVRLMAKATLTAAPATAPIVITKAHSTAL